MLAWNLEYGHRVSTYESIYKKTGKMPTALKKRPTVSPHLLEYWNGFVALDRSRQWSFGAPIGIQYSEILAYGAIHGFVGENMDDFARIVGKLDDFYLDWRADNGKT